MSDVNFNKTDIDSKWTVKRHDSVKRRRERYKSDGYLFTEDREARFIKKQYQAVAHSHDEWIQNHREVDPSGFFGMGYIPPWFNWISDMSDEITTSWKINFREDGTAKAGIETTELVDGEWKVIKKHKPQPLEGSL